jgi:tryptophanase
VCKNINEVSPSEVKGDRSKSVLFDAYRLAKNVREIRNDDAEWETKKMWKFITQVWVEMLAYAASNCRSLYHAQHLRHGGELLTHVWLLMAHLGITDKLQISKGFGRAKLIRK